MTDKFKLIYMEMYAHKVSLCLFGKDKILCFPNNRWVFIYGDNAVDIFYCKYGIFDKH